MPISINYYWRIIGTGFSFLLFGIGGLFLRIIVFPILNIFIRNRNHRVAIARNIIRLSFRSFIELMRIIGVLHYKIEGLQRLDRRGLLILANHPTLIDTVFLMAFVKQADCIVKSALWRNPFMFGAIHAAGYICNDNGFGLIEQCLTSLQQNSNLIIFPEGTRTTSDGTITFKRGAAAIAIRCQCKVTPVIIQCNPSTLTKGEKWWNVPSRVARFHLKVLEDIDVNAIIPNTDSETLAARRLTGYLQNYFVKEIQRYART